MSGPVIKPKTKKDERRVFLEPSLWADLDEVAEFHQLVFEAMGAKEKVSRNDVIEGFLRWAADEYWKDKGGKPGSSKDRQDKAKRHADKLKSSEG